MGQEQSSLVSQTNSTKEINYKDNYEEPIRYRCSSVNRSCEDLDYRRHKPRRSAHSFKSDNSASTESSGYRSGSSGYDYSSEISSKNDYYNPSFYKNDHFKGDNKEIYKPIKISREKKYMLPLYKNKDEIKSARLSSYFSEEEKANLKAGLVPKKSGIRNYTPKILSDEEQSKTIDNWV